MKVCCRTQSTMEGWMVSGVKVTCQNPTPAHHRPRHPSALTKRKNSRYPQAFAKLELAITTLPTSTS